MATAENEKPTLAYASAATFNTTLDHLHTVEIPNMIDRNALPPSFSGSSKYEMLGTLRFFGLIDADGKPDRARLDPLTNPETRKETLTSLLETHYPGLFALPLSTAGPTEISRWFADNATPSTVGKAKSFFLALAKQVGIPMHSMVAKNARVAAGSVRRKRRKKAVEASNGGGGGEAAGKPAEQRLEQPPGGSMRQVSLRGGAGTLTLGVTVNLWDLEGEDLAFVTGMMNALKAYEKGETPAFPGPR
jgi:hypothetical protein